MFHLCSPERAAALDGLGRQVQALIERTTRLLQVRARG